MYVLGARWSDGYLDYHRGPTELRIRVAAWWPVQKVEDVHLPQPRSLRRVANYVSEIGMRATLRKIRSRLAERLRDERFVAVGIGSVLEADVGDPLADATVVFVAPCHPRCVDRVVLDRSCVTVAPHEWNRRFTRTDVVTLLDGVPATAPPQELALLAGWSPQSGERVDQLTPAVLEWALTALATVRTGSERELAVSPASPVTETIGTAPRRTALRAALFGYGNYAKTVVLPNIHPQIAIASIHEIEPTQLGRVRTGDVVYDTSPFVRDTELYDVYLIAGYHHTHAGLAIEALRRGGYAVVEKPLVTTRDQLGLLLREIDAHPGKYFSCFHMRYNPLWAIAREHLRIAAGDPVHAHAIVYEIPLVRRHWYNWPASGSRIVSNGCHWIDHFLFMNAFARPTRWDAWCARNGDLHVSIELENGAVFGMALTDHGSQRLGVQDHVELRANGVTVKVTNGSRYWAEDVSRVLDRRRIKRTVAYESMYRTISARILAREAGDTFESIARTAHLMLAIEDAVQRGRRAS
jgi:predicted dehydrogenase